MWPQGFRPTYTQPRLALNQGGVVNQFLVAPMPMLTPLPTYQPVTPSIPFMRHPTTNNFLPKTQSTTPSNKPELPALLNIERGNIAKQLPTTLDLEEQAAAEALIALSKPTKTKQPADTSKNQDQKLKRKNISLPANEDPFIGRKKSVTHQDQTITYLCIAKTSPKNYKILVSTKENWENIEYDYIGPIDTEGLPHGKGVIKDGSKKFSVVMEAGKMISLL